MLKSIKRVLITLIILTAAAVLGIYFYTKDRTYYSKDTESGNTLGNIYNGGLFCVQDKTIYFSNDNAGGKLYKMDLFCTNMKKVSDDRAAYINADENYIYYSRINNIKEYSTDFYVPLSNNGLYRIDNNGLNLKAITGDPSAFTILMGNYLFFERYTVNNGFDLARFKIDGSMGRNLVLNALPFYYAANHIYYVDNSKGANISSMDLSSFTKKTFREGSYVYPIQIGNYIYYINAADQNRIYRMNSDGTKPTLLVKEPCSTYNITVSGKYLYYQTNGAKKDRIGRMNMENFQNETVRIGRYKQINVTNYYIFFKSPLNKKTYMQLADGKIDVLTFKAGK